MSIVRDAGQAEKGFGQCACQQQRGGRFNGTRSIRHYQGEIRWCDLASASGFYEACYCDETGIGSEPIAVMVGVVVDSQRMHITKEDWDDLLGHLSGIVGVRLKELHTRDFYSGNSPFRGIAGPKRSEYISTIFQWFADRKHHFIHTAIDKNAFRSAVTMDAVPPEIQTVWRCMGAHIILAAQRAFQKIEKTRGHTIFIFDNE